MSLADQNRHLERIPFLSTGVGFGLALYLLAWVYTWGGCSKGIDTGSWFQQFVSVLIAGPAFLALNRAYSANLPGGAKAACYLLVYLGTFLVWLLVSVLVARSVRCLVFRLFGSRPSEGTAAPGRWGQGYY